MSSTKSRKSISDQINDVLKPKELVEETDENEAKIEEFREFSDSTNKNVHLSSIRKQSAKNLSELDSKYKGKIVSRKEWEDESVDSDELKDSEDESEKNDECATDSEDESNNSDVDDENESADDDMDESDGNEDDYEDDFDMLGLSEYGANSSERTSNGKTDILKSVSLDDEIKKGVCVQNQLKIWEKLLEVRIKSQKMLITANRLPNFTDHLELSTVEDSPFAEKVDETCSSIHSLLDNLLELQRTLVTSFPESKDILKTKKRKKDEDNQNVLKRTKLADYSEEIGDDYEAYKEFRNKTLDKWHERTKTVKDLKNPFANINIVSKIENALLGKNEMIRKTQLYRGDFEVFGGLETLQQSEDNNDEVHLPEIFDDSEFYHQLLRELIEYKSNIDENQSEITRKFVELQKVRNKMKKKVDTRASKGRKIRYIVHNKLVNFMPPKDESEMTDEARTELFNSLFGINNSTAEIL
ncbi:CLUMA_CG001415, isoform A [Clunio marinus]|uniref:CLUMA_CG001415, isoform A n=1 Tax=Clunio marinus TaxID=568069 RepID=A0A1J1HI90_9DIPT|nr:CLUMA_CG001415, isoform A [Clunio marinus]